MKCVCGYEHEAGLDESGKWNDRLKGDAEFILITGSTFKIWEHDRYMDTREVRLFACPKCFTVQTDKDGS